MTNEADTPGNAGETEVVLPVRVIGLDDQPAVFANIIQVNYLPSAFQVVLAQWLPPALASPDQVQQVAERGYAVAHVVARLVLTPQMVEESIQVLQAQLDQYRAREVNRAPNDEEPLDDRGSRDA